MYYEIASNIIDEATRTKRLEFVESYSATVLELLK
jgi:hypothetical protein